MSEDPAIGTTVETIVLNGCEIPIVVDPACEQRGQVDAAYAYDYRWVPQAIRVRALDDLDGRVLLHEVLHALVGTDPQNVLPPHDARHEDFVRMLTAGLHDAAGYRRDLTQSDPAADSATRLACAVQRVLALADEYEADGDRRIAARKPAWPLNVAQAIRAAVVGTQHGGRRT